MICHLRSAGLDFTPVLAVYFVHGGEVIHICDEHVDFHDFVEVGS